MYEHSVSSRSTTTVFTKYKEEQFWTTVSDNNIVKPFTTKVIMEHMLHIYLFTVYYYIFPSIRSIDSCLSRTACPYIQYFSMLATSACAEADIKQTLKRFFNALWRLAGRTRSSPRPFELRRWRFRAADGLRQTDKPNRSARCAFSHV